MEESKDLEKLHGLFRSFVYISILIEIVLFIPREWLGPANIVFDKIRPIAIYQNILFSKAFTLLLVLINSIGTKAKKRIDFDIKKMVYYPIFIGILIILFSVYSLSLKGNFYFSYMFCSLLGVIFVHIGFDSLSKIIKENLVSDKFNLENESFMQAKDKVENKYSVNIPTQFYYKGKMNSGWINVENPFRGTWVLGTPGSGKTFGIIEPIIRQHAAKGFSLVVYDYKFPTLGTKLYYHYAKNKANGNLPQGCKFRMINFTHVELSHRINPIQRKYIPNLAAASETASTLIESLQKGQSNQGGGADDFFKKSAENFLAAIIFFFTRWNDGEYSDMAHVLAFLNLDYETIFDVLTTNPEVTPLLAPFMTAYKNKAMDQLEGMIGTLRVNCGRLATKESFWILTGDDFDLRVSDPSDPAYLLIANDPEMESINTSLNALILNTLVRRINSGLGKNLPSNIIIDELPTLYFHKIDRLVGTARSNKVAVTLGFQELPQLEGDYGKVGMQKILAVCGNVICASARNKETLDWLSNSIFGKVRQVRKGLSIDRSKTTLSLNEEMGDLIPAAKIADMPTGFLCGQTARDFIPTDSSAKRHFDIQNSEEFKTTKFFGKVNLDLEEIKAEEAEYPKSLPIIYDFGDPENKEELLTKNYRKIINDIQILCKKVRTS